MNILWLYVEGWNLLCDNVDYTEARRNCSLSMPVIEWFWTYIFNIWLLDYYVSWQISSYPTLKSSSFFQIQCQAMSEEEIHAVLSEQSLYPAGWIHVYTLAFPYFMNFVFFADSIEMKNSAHTSCVLHLIWKDKKKLIAALDAFLVAACNSFIICTNLFFLSVLFHFGLLQFFLLISEICCSPANFRGKKNVLFGIGIYL